MGVLLLVVGVLGAAVAGAVAHEDHLKAVATAAWAVGIGLGLPFAIGLIALLVVRWRTPTSQRDEARERATEAEEREAALIAERDRAPVPQLHEEHLKNVLRNLSGNIAQHQLCNYEDPVVGAQENRKSVVAHFPDLAAALDAWDVAVGRAHRAPQALGVWIGEQAHARGIDDADGAIEVVARLTALVSQRAKQGKLGEPAGLNLDREQTVEDELFVKVGEHRVLRMAPDDSQKRFTEAEQLLQDLFASAQTSDAAKEIEDAERALIVDLAPPLQQLRARHVMSTPIHLRAPECPACQTHVELTALPVSAGAAPAA
jgi:hypothetical protein